MRNLALLAAAAVLSAGSVRADEPPSINPVAYGESVGPLINLTAGTVSGFGAAASAGLIDGNRTVEASGIDSQTDASAVARWGMFIEGGSTDDLIPIEIDGRYSMAAGDHDGSASVLLFLYVGLNLDKPLLLLSCGFDAPCSSDTFSLHTKIHAETLEEIDIAAQGSGTFSAFMDPVVSFDRTTNFDFSPYTLLGAADAEPPIGGVPEPAAWTLMILGFSAAGGALRRRRSGAVVA